MTEFIEIGGKERPIQFGCGAITIYCDTLDCDLEGLDDIFMGGVKSIKAIPVLVYAGLKNAAELAYELHGTKPDKITLAQVREWLDRTPASVQKEVIDAFKRSYFMGRTIEQYYLGDVSDDEDEDSSGSDKKSRLTLGEVISRSYQMGLGVLEVKSLTLVSFTQLLKGYYDRQEEQWDMTRHIMSTVMNYGGMGSSKFVSPEEVIKLSRDDRGKVRYITTMKSAIELLESMKPIILLSLNNRQE